MPKKQPAKIRSKKENLFLGSKKEIVHTPNKQEKENNNKEKIPPVIFLGLTIIAIITRFYLFGYPPEVVFDEVHFGKFILAYLEKKSFFDIHPPFAKLLIAGFAKILSFKTDCTFLNIGQSCSGETFLFLRFLPSVFSFLFIFVFYLFLSELTSSKTTGLIGAFFIALENGFIVQGRLILIDIFLLFFGFLTLFLILKYQQKKDLYYLLLAGLSLGFTISTKWTGLSFIVSSLLIFLIQKESIKEKIKNFSILLLLSFFVYLFSFWVHFKIIPNQGEQALFVGYDFEKLNFLQKFLTMNKIMYTSQSSLNQVTHPYQSNPIEWLFMKKEIFYWTKENKKIFFTGNIFLWYSATLSLFFLIGSFFSLKMKKFFNYSNFLLLFLLLSFLSNYLPFFSLQRPIFLYHYLPAYAFLLANLAILTEKTRKSFKIIFFLILILSIIGFLKNFAITFGI